MKIELHKLINKYFIDISPRIILVNKFTISSVLNTKTLFLLCLGHQLFTNTCAHSVKPSTWESPPAHFTCGWPSIGGGVFVLIHNILANPSHSSIRAHCEGTCNIPVSSSGFTILDSAPDFVSLRILESLHIFKLNHSINDTNSSFPLYIVK